MNGHDDWLVQAAEQELRNTDRDNFSFEDSERFEDDSEYSFGSSEESVNQNWRGWNNDAHETASNRNASSAYSAQFPTSGRFSSASSVTIIPNRSRTEVKGISSLAELSAKCCARKLSFEQLENCWEQIKDINKTSGSLSIPENLFLAITYWCFPTSVEDIRLYSCLANGNGEEFVQGGHFFSSGSVRDVVQIGYLVSATVFISSDFTGGSTKTYSVSLRVDRCRIVACSCSCPSRSAWCQHVVALSLHRLLRPDSVEYRVTIWDSVNELRPDKLKKFAQYLINELPREYLPIAQKLLDQLKAENSAISTALGAPDPTDGGHESVALWAIEDADLHIRIRRLLQNYCIPSPVIFSDVGSMTAPIHSQHPIALEYRTLRKCLKAKEPEGLWNLLSIVREMIHRQDENSLRLLKVITEECIANVQVLIWWYVSKLLLSNEWVQLAPGKNPDSCHNAVQLNSALLCDELVYLWKLISLNPTLQQEQRKQLFIYLQNLQRITCERIFMTIKSSTPQSAVTQMISTMVLKVQPDVKLSIETARFGMVYFPGFHSALHACNSFLNEVPLYEDNIGATYSMMSHWASSSTVPLLPEMQIIPPSPAKSRKIKKKWKTNRRNNQQNRNRVNPVNNDEESSGESGQESEQDGQGSSGILRPGYPHEDVDGVLAASFSPMDKFEYRFGKCDAMAAHGFGDQAVELALDLISYEPGDVDPWSLPTTYNSSLTDMEQESRIIGILEKTLRVSQILRNKHDEKLFSFVLRILRFPKRPMLNRFYQFKEYFMECELIDILKYITLSEESIKELRTTAKELLKRNMIGAVPHVTLAHFIMDKLSMEFNLYDIEQTGQSRSKLLAVRLPMDDDLCLEVALNALGARAVVSEEEFPMLNEVLRRQKGDLAVAMMSRYKDSREKLGLIMDKLLDPHIHRMYKNHNSNAAFFIKRDTILGRHSISGQRPVYPYPDPSVSRTSSVEEDSVKPAPAGGERLGTTDSTSDFNDEPCSSTRSSTDSDYQPSTNRATIQTNTVMKRWKCKKMEVPTEAQSQYMSELSKRVVEEAGGNQNPAIFAAPMGPTGQGSHRNLRICAVLIALYGLGLHNKVSRSWNTRTYNGNISWISSQAVEIGAVAIELIREMWESHFTPSEAASLADKANSESRDGPMTKEAAELALSVIPFANALSTSEIQKALLQCREQGSAMLLKGCEALQEIYKRDSLSADLLFLVGRYWEDLYHELDLPKNVMGQLNVSSQQYPPPAPHSMYGHPTMPSYPVPPPTCMVPPISNSMYPYGQMTTTVAPSMMHHNLAVSTSSGGEASRLHQSHSAPQLTATPNFNRINEGVDNRLVNAHLAGMRALEALGQIAPDDSSARSKYATHECDIIWLYELSRRLGPVYAFNFLDMCCRSITAPMILFRLAIESTTLVKHYYHTNTPIPQPSRPLVQMVPPPKVYASVAGQVRQTLLCHNHHPITAELLEKCIEHFFISIARVLNYSRFNASDKDEVQRLFQGAFDALRFVPSFCGRTIFDELCRQARKQRAVKREVANYITELQKRFTNDFQQRNPAY